MYNNGIQSYRKTNVITSDPVRLVIMCYEGAIDNLKLAKEKMKEKDYE
ncbi:MAG: flagellar protein FliS, partial [Deltaproteobacteria bacterium]|nr:flagellar protein FliS [Deltaproteobacteria bacterium]